MSVALKLNELASMGAGREHHASLKEAAPWGTPERRVGDFRKRLMASVFDPQKKEPTFR